MKIKNILKVGVSTFTSRVLGLFRDIALARFLGVGASSDMLFIAFKIPNMFRRIFAEGSMQAVFVPIFSSAYKEDSDKARQFSGQIFTMLLISLLFVVILLEIFAPYVVKIISPGFANKGEEVFRTTVFLVRITIPYLFFISLASFYSSILNTAGRFIIGSFLPAFLNISIIVCLFLPFSSMEYSTKASLGFFVGGAVQLLIVWYSCKRIGWVIKLDKIKSLYTETKLFFKRLVPVLFGSGVYQINMIVDLMAASVLPFGAISFLFYADRVYQLPLAIIGIAIGTVILPFISDKTLSIEKQHATKEKAMLLGISFSLAAMLGILLFGDQIIKSIFLGGEFSVSDAIETSTVLQIFVISLPINILVKIMLPFFYSEGDTKSPFYVSVMCMIFNVSIVFFLAALLGYKGIALAAVFVSILNLLLLYGYLFKKYNFRLSGYFYKELIKIIKSIAYLFIIGAGVKMIMLWATSLENMLVYRLWLAFVVLIIICMFVIVLKINKSVVYEEIKNLLPGKK